MPPSPIKLSKVTARRFHRRLLRLDDPFESVAEAIDWMGFVQIDPINVCGRMHDLILRNRVTGYREGDLFKHMHRSGRPGFEHHFPGSGNLVAMPAEAWPFLLPGMKERRRSDSGYARRLDSEEQRLARRILKQIRDEGPISSDAIRHDGTTTSAWGRPGRMAKTVLDKLFFHGRVLISERSGFRRIYDLPERILPSEILNARTPTAARVVRWTLHTHLKQRRLAILRPNEVKVLENLIQPIEVPECPTVWCLRSDLPLLESEPPPSETRLIAPLDPLIYDRRLTEKLWDFDYRWEVYTPAPKRVRGYYALPLLSGSGFVGYVDLKADRPKKRLQVVSRKVVGRRPVAAAIRQLSNFLALNQPRTTKESTEEGRVR